MKNEITRADVAALAGVSGMTVSRVLNNSPLVTEETRRAVLEASRKLKYRPNAFAAALRNKKSHAIGVMVPTFKHSFYGRMLSALELVMRDAGYHIIVIQLEPQFSNAKSEWSKIEFLLSRQIDGLILDVSLSASTEARLLNEDLPVVFVDAPPNLSEYDFIGTADTQGMREVTDFLLSQGHQRIGYIGGIAQSKTNLARREGWQNALTHANIDWQPDWIFEKDFSYGAGKELILENLSRVKTFSALACANDYLAVGVIAELRNSGCRVPDDISVTGFADDEIAALSSPGVTSFHQPIEEIAQKAAQLLVDKIKGRAATPGTINLLPGHLVIRDSTMKIAKTPGKH